MGRLIKTFLLFIAALMLLIIITAIALPFFINPNDFREEIQLAVKEKIDRDLKIEGDLEISIFPWIGVSTNKLTLSNTAEFSDTVFASIEKSNIKVKLLPLLSKKIEVDRVVLKGLVLNLMTTKEGNKNWEGLGQTEKDENQGKDNSAKNPEEETMMPLAAFAIGGLSIEQASIIWDDRQSNKKTEINDFNLTTDRLKFDQPIAINLSLTIKNKEPEFIEKLDLSADLIINKQLNKFKFDAINLVSITQGKEIPGEKITANLLTGLVVDLGQQTLELNNLSLNIDKLALSANIKGTNIIDKPVFKGAVAIHEFNLAQLMKKMAMPLPVMQDEEALNKFSIKFDLLAHSGLAKFQNVAIQLDETHISGSSTIKNFSKPSIEFNLKLDSINADRYLAPDEETKTTSKNKTELATPASVAIATATLFPVEALRKLNLNGSLGIDQLKINGLKLQDVNLKINAKKGLIQTQQTIKKLYQGSYTGRTIINVKNKTPMLSLNEKLSKVHIEPLLMDVLGEAKLSGIIDTTAKIHGRGNTVTALKSTLNGNMNFNFRDGFIRGINLQQLIDNTRSFIKGSPLPTNDNDKTKFSVMKGSVTIKNGLIKNEDLYLQASKLRVNGQGTANLISEKLDYKINAKLLKKNVTDSAVEKINGLPIIVNIGGTFSHPNYVPDVAAMLLDKNRVKLNKKAEKLFKKLDDKIGPGVSDLLKGFF